MCQLLALCSPALCMGVFLSPVHGSLPAPARGQTDVLQHGTMLGHVSIQLEVRTNICCFSRICASGKCAGDTGKNCLSSEHGHSPSTAAVGWLWVRGDIAVLQC